MKRINPSDELTASISGSGTLTEIEALGSSGVWYDTAAKLAALQAGQEDEAIAKHWYELLESVGLAEIAAVPIAIEH